MTQQQSIEFVLEMSSRFEYNSFQVLLKVLVLLMPHDQTPLEFLLVSIAETVMSLLIITIESPPRSEYYFINSCTS